MNVILTKGIMGSGKTSWAKKYITEHSNWKRVSRDDIRHQISNYTFNKKNEKLVQEIWKAQVEAILKSGYNLIVDETHLNPPVLASNKGFITSVNPKVNISVNEFKCTLEEAIERDKRREFSVGEKVIRNVYKKYIAEQPERDCYDWGFDRMLPTAVICDIDGTLAIKHPDRDIYDGSKAHMDIVIKPTLFILANIKKNTKIIFLSGRDSKHRDVTEKWLLDNVSPDREDFELIMRKENDNRRDDIIKKELYRSEIEPRYNVLFVFDDRPQVLRMWQNELGLFTFNVNQDVDCLHDF